MKKFIKKCLWAILLGGTFSMYGMYGIVKSEDILLDLTEPVFSDKKIRVATYYRNEPNFYFFTMVYKQNKKLYTKITFELVDAAYVHKKAEHWVRKRIYEIRMYGDGKGEIPEEPFPIVPFTPSLYQGPLVDAFKQSEGEVYWIHPSIRK